MKDRIAQEHTQASRAKVKRQLLDALDERHKFDLPPTLVDQEFDNVWKTVEDDLKQQGRTLADEGTNEDDAKAEYRKIAERRVRLGPGDRRDRRQERHQGDRRRGLARGRRARAPVPGPGAAGLGFLPQQSERARRACARRSTRKRSSTSCSELAKVTEKKVSREELYKQDDDEAEKSRNLTRAR